MCNVCMHACICMYAHMHSSMVLGFRGTARVNLVPGSNDLGLREAGHMFPHVSQQAQAGLRD